MSRPWALGVLVLAVFAVSCGGDGDGDGEGAPEAGVFVPADQADVVAHAAIPGPDELPGGAWVITEEDVFDDDDDDLDFDTYFRTEPSCEDLAGLAELGSLFGGSTGDDDDLPVGRAQAAFEDASALSPLAPEIDVEIEIEETVAEVEGAWSIVAGLVENSGFEDCMVAVFNDAFTNDLEFEGLELTVRGREARGTTPNRGFALAFDIDMSFAGTDLEMVTEVHIWPYGNAGATVAFLGASDGFDSSTIQETLDLVAEKLETAAGQAGAS